MPDRWRWALGLAVVAAGVAIVSTLVMGGAFTGTDTVATQALADQGVTPWFPSLTAWGPRTERILFAVQAGLGGGLLGYFLGALRERRRKAG